MRSQTINPGEETFFAETPAPFTYRHSASLSNDFERQPLLLNMISNSGPASAVADVNGDGLEDIVFGGGRGEPSTLYLQSADGSFRTKKLHGEDPVQSVEDLVFADFDGDGDTDLYTACGGYHDFRRNDAAFQDMLYLNHGSGTFIAAKGRLPAMQSSKTSIAACDFEGDGDIDLFIGGGCIPGEYPMADVSYLLINDGNGRFLNVLPAVLPELSRAGMISDAEWVDLDKDGYEDLVVAGDFMPVRVFLNKGGNGLQEASGQFFSTPQSGRWSALETGDFDMDGDEDIVLGNFGLNTLLMASPEEPVGLYYGDFDVNGFIDPVFTYHAEGKVYPMASRYEMLGQIKSLEQKFPTHESYSNATLQDIFPQNLLEHAGYTEASTLSSMVLLNEEGSLRTVELPLEAQFAPVYAIEISDFNSDGFPDLLMAGNQSANRVRLGPVDASFGQLYLGDGTGHFRYVPQLDSGLKTRGDARSISLINYNGKKMLVFGVNNSPAEFYFLDMNPTK
jgi:hypothetical protein